MIDDVFVVRANGKVYAIPTATLAQFELRLSPEEIQELEASVAGFQLPTLHMHDGSGVPSLHLYDGSGIPAGRA